MPTAPIRRGARHRRARLARPRVFCDNPAQAPLEFVESAPPKGCTIAISSGLSRVPGRGFCAHSAAESGRDGFAKSLALELGPLGIRVTVVAPGLTLTDATAWQPQVAKEAATRRTPLRRNGQPEDVAAAVLALASDDARFITGTYLPVSGGIQML